ncbi:putative Polycomb group protein ASXL2 isoform X2 [Limulus polyphemus]|uniref:Polycomb group protein ASXL2 isoform X2 n=1 Tax=Limulus polyphemus TaxID=6850 RepID=A0ABM1SKC7_LIMPO|nr:putative Polycomb group protein ASXL2 isoform X2 [Limulus polyphemus]
MQQEFIRDKQAKKKKVKTWSEAAKLVLEMHPKTPMNHTDILDEIQATGVKDVSGSGSLVCLSAALRAQSRGPSAVFYRVSGANSVFGLKSEIPEGALVIDVEEDLTEEIDVEEASSNKTKSICNQKVLCVQLPPSYNKPSNSRPSSKLVDTGATISEVQNKRDLKSGGDMLSNLDYSFSKSLTKNERTTSLSEKTKVFNGNFEDYPKTQKRKLSSDEEANSMADLGLNKSVHSPLSSPVGSPSPGKISQSHSQRAIKHALRQQQKRRKRNTAIAASSNSTPPIPRIIMKPLPPPPKSSARIMSTNSLEDNQDKDEDSMSDSEKKDLSSTYSKPQTMRELLASIPGLSLKPRKRSNKKLSTAAQIAQTKKGCIDVETPDSILVNINLKALINKHTFASLPSLYQYRLVQLLPSVDRVIGPDYSVRLSASALSNEFFARACQDWQKRLAEGEFTPENQQKMKAEVEKEKGKLDPWKLKYFEPVWGKKSIVDISDQGKTSSFRMGTSSLKSSLNTPTKHVPTIKIKPVVKKNRLVPAILKHRPQGTIISSGLGNPLQNKVTSPKEVANIPSPLKRPSKVVADPEASLIKKQKTSILPIAPKPSVVTVPCEESSAYQSVFLTTSPCSQNTEPNSQSVHQQQAPVMSLSHSPRFNLGTTSGDSATPLVPPITIRSVPIVRHASSTPTSKHSAEHGPINLERSYQICQAVLESSRNRSQFFSSGNRQIKARPGLAPVKTRSLSCPATMTSITSSSSGVSSVAVTSLVNTSSPSTLMGGAPLLQTAVHHVSNKTSSQSSSLLTTCLPSTTQAYAVSLSPSPNNSAPSRTTQTSSTVVTPTEAVVSLRSGSISQAVDTIILSSSGQETVLSPASGTETVVTVPVDIGGLEEHNSFVLVDDPADASAASSSEQLILLTNDISLAVDSANNSNSTTVVIASEDGTIEGLLNGDCKVSDAKNSRVLLIIGDVDSNSAALLSSNLDFINDLGTSTDKEEVNNVNDGGSIVVTAANGVHNQLPYHCITRDEKFPEEYLIITDNEEVSDQDVLNSVPGETDHEQEFELNFRESDFSQPSDCPVVCQPVLVAGNISELKNSDCFDRGETKKRSISCISVTQSTDSIHNFSTSATSSETVRPFTAPPVLNQVPENNVIMVESQRENSLKRSSSCKELHEPSNTKYYKTTISIEKDAQTTSVSALPETSAFTGNVEKLLPKQTSNVSPSTNKPSSCSVISSNGITPTLSILKDTKISTSVDSHAVGVVSGKTITSKTCHNSGVVVSANHIQSSGMTTGGVLTNHIILNSFPYPHSAISSSAASGKSIFTCSTPLPAPGILDSQNLVSCTLPQPESRGLMTSQNVSLVPALTQMSVMSTGVVLPQVPKNGVTAPSGGQEGRNTGLSLTPVTMTTGMVIGGGIPGSGVPPGDPNGARGNCACNLKAMVMCQKCGAFCHDDCIGPSRLCVTCLIR